MLDAPMVDRDIDARGLLCPMPILKLAQAIKEIEPGQVVRLHATDPGAGPDVTAWATSTGNSLVHEERDGKEMRFWIRKASANGVMG